MKNILTCIFLIYTLGCQTKAQKSIKKETCANPVIAQQAEILKQQSISEGFVLLKEDYMMMVSQYEQPVILPMNEGALYQIIFIGDPTANVVELRMYDWKEKQVKYEKKASGNYYNNVVQFYYRPKNSEYHIIKPVQINKKKKLCGYLMLLKKVK